MNTLVLSRESAHALFASDLSARREHTQAEIVTAIRQAISTHHGLGGCAGQVAAAYGEHPETAAGRMRWAWAVIQALQAPGGWPQAALWPTRGEFAAGPEPAARPIRRGCPSHVAGAA
jgi:hypothetical protein